MQKNTTQSTRVADRLRLFPDSTTVENDELYIAGHDIASLVEEYGTPLYIYDRLTMDASLAEYQSALKRYYPSSARITYAGKAFLSKTIAGWARGHNLLVDCTGEGEITIALAAGVLPENILVHGVNKSVSDIRSALQNAQVIVVDNLSELHHMGSTSSSDSQDVLVAGVQKLAPGLQIWLRLVPGVAVHTHHTHTQTGQHDSKFGMTREELLEAARLCREKDLPLTGIHFHQGSNFRDPEPMIPAIDMALDLAKEIGFRQDWHLCPGGGWGMAYHEEELPNPSIESYVRGIAEAVVEGCQSRGLSLPELHLEPGRSLIARAGVAVYRVGAVKRRPGKTWLLVDGGMADNPRFALYSARYTCLPAAGLSREGSRQVSIAGPFCESGDILIENLMMPEVQEGELIAIPVAGAYQLSMSSNYNGARRPAVLWLEEGKVKLMVRRETIQDLLKNQL
jgi:diaminopimelate decarboxylase